MQETAKRDKLDPEKWLLALMREQVLRDGRDNPTPECVPPAFLRDFAHSPDSFALDDPRVEHVVKCAYCLPKVLHLRSQNAARKTMRVRIAVIALACVLLITAGIATIHYWHGSPVRHQNPTVTAVTLNLTDYPTLRGAGGDSPSTPLALPASRLDLTLILPRFSDPGSYSVSLCPQRQGGQNFASASTTAVVEGDKMVLKVLLDLSTVRPGSYWLSTEHQGDGGAYYYPVQIR